MTTFLCYFSKNYSDLLPTVCTIVHCTVQAFPCTVQYSMAFKFRAEHPSFSFQRVRVTASFFFFFQIVTCYRSVFNLFQRDTAVRVIIFPMRQSFFSSLFSNVSRPISLEGWKESLSGNFRQPVIFFNPDTALRGCPALRK